MRQSGAYGQMLREKFRLDAAPALVTRALRKSKLAVTECRSDAPEHGLSGSLLAEDAYLVSLKFRDYPACESWEGGRCVAKTDVRAGATYLYDLKRDPRYVINKPFHSIFFYLPRSAFDAIADQSHADRIGELKYQPGVGHDDAVIRHLGASMLEALKRPEEASQLFVDHVTQAVIAHVAHVYGGLRPTAKPARGGLTGRQRKRACDILEANLAGDMALKDVAAECGLSVSHFSRAFRETVGLAPHKWLLHRRIEAAKALIKAGRLSLSEVAIASGFADQSHFTRVFSTIVGVTPGVWRRCCELGAEDPWA
ncbi:MAG TPA: AraC family transcriptional regulator [Aliidongia sp.]|nr:AraC family transcriptional regulator [Aliidongia sp.]